MRIGIAFDLAPSGPKPVEGDGPDDLFEEFDKPETVEAIAAVLRGRGHAIDLLGDGPEFLRRVLDSPPDLVWNIAEGRGIGRCREARVPAALEMLGIPYTGSDPFTLIATLDKDLAKRLLTFDGRVSCPAGVACAPDVREADFRHRVGQLFEWTRGRALLKPNIEGSSKGIRSRCLVDSVEGAWTVFRGLRDDYGQTILVEQYIEGHEVTVGLVGIGTILGAMGVIPKRPTPDFIYSIEVKRDWERRVDYESPANLADDVRDLLFDSARAAYETLGCRDIARIDYRIGSGVPYFLEANPLPGLAPVTSDLVILAEGHGIPYADLIGRIFEASLARLGMIEHASGTSGR